MPARPRSALKALEDARFGGSRTLNLRASLPTPQDAVARTDQWLRMQQAHQGGDVLIITGRGNGSVGGVSVVRVAVQKLLGRLKRAGVIASVKENTPGSFVVGLAALRTLVEAPRRHRGHADPIPTVSALPGLDRETHALLIRVAHCALDRLGVRDRDRFLDDEVRRQFSLITADLPAGPRRDEHLREALLRLLAEYEES